MFTNEIINAEMQSDRQFVRCKVFAVTQSLALKSLQFLPYSQKCSLYVARGNETRELQSRAFSATTAIWRGDCPHDSSVGLRQPETFFVRSVVFQPLEYVTLLLNENSFAFKFAVRFKLTKIANPPWRDKHAHGPPELLPLSYHRTKYFIDHPDSDSIPPLLDLNKIPNLGPELWYDIQSCDIGRCRLVSSYKLDISKT